ncbi:hypothetical protein BDY24DRAFT_392992 [Mrakia frigida]|uniref:uncharacterized protein n=1 Tax=Mrakia frigida TaxID=29902 RepID=UPI003FCC22E1
MYLHHHLTTPSPELFSQDRIAVIWAILRGRHPLLASKVVRSGEDDEWQFKYSPPATPTHAVSLALNSLAFPNSNLSSTDLISHYLNGPRLLSAQQLSFLVISSSSSSNSTTSSSFSSNQTQHEFDFLLCTTHFVGDGIALHTFANEFYGLVVASGEEGGGEPRTVEELMEVLGREMREREESGRMELPLSTENLLAEKQASKVGKVASKLALERSQRRAIGSQTLPRSRSSNEAQVHTVVPTISYPVDQTKRILAKCKKEGVSVSNAVFGLVGVAWARLLESGMIKDGRVEEPLLLYSALSLRGLLPPTPPSTPAQSYFHLSLGYYTVTLPSFLPSNSTNSPSAITQTFWHRSRSTKAQTVVHLKSKLLVGKASAEAEQRREKAVKWAQEDDMVETEKQRKVLEVEEMKRKEEGGQGGGGLLGLGIGLEAEQEQGARFGDRYRQEGESKGLIASKMGELRIDQNDDGLPTTSTPPTTPGRVDNTSTFAKFQTLSPSKATSSSLTSNTSNLPLTPPTTPRAPSQAETPSLKPSPSSSSSPSPPPTAPLLGLSLLGNLDAIYAHSTYFPYFTLTALTTGSRQRQGAALLFSYTFVGKLWLSLGWDEAGFGEEGKMVVESLWEGLNGGVKEFLDC